MRGEIVGYLGVLNGVFTHPRSGNATERTTHYFAMEFLDDDGVHDGEHDGVEWMSVQAAYDALKATMPVKEEFLIVERLEKFLRLCATRPRA